MAAGALLRRHSHVFLLRRSRTGIITLTLPQRVIVTRWLIPCGCQGLRDGTAPLCLHTCPTHPHTCPHSLPLLPHSLCAIKGEGPFVCLGLIPIQAAPTIVVIFDPHTLPATGGSLKWLQFRGTHTEGRGAELNGHRLEVGALGNSGRARGGGVRGGRGGCRVQREVPEAGLCLLPKLTLSQHRPDTLTPLHPYTLASALSIPYDWIAQA